MRDITPLAALKHLKKLSFAGTQPQSEVDKPRVEDLTPLKDMKLESLNMAWCKVKDLSLLKGMPLKVIDCTACPGVFTLTPLKGMAMEVVNAGKTSIITLDAAQGRPADGPRHQLHEGGGSVADQRSAAHIADC